MTHKSSCFSRLLEFPLFGHENQPKTETASSHHLTHRHKAQITNCVVERGRSWLHTAKHSTADLVCYAVSPLADPPSVNNPFVLGLACPWVPSSEHLIFANDHPSSSNRRHPISESKLPLLFCPAVPAVLLRQEGVPTYARARFFQSLPSKSPLLPDQPQPCLAPTSPSSPWPSYPSPPPSPTSLPHPPSTPPPSKTSPQPDPSTSPSPRARRASPPARARPSTPAASSWAAS